MTQYIDKKAIVTEIERRIHKEIQSCTTNLGYSQGFVDSMRNLLSFFDTIEVKEVDLDKEARHYLLYGHKSPLSTIMHQADLHSEMQYHEDIENSFKAGFELGIKTKEVNK